MRPSCPVGIGSWWPTFSSWFSCGLLSSGSVTVPRKRPRKWPEATEWMNDQGSRNRLCRGSGAAVPPSEWLAARHFDYLRRAFGDRADFHVASEFIAFPEDVHDDSVDGALSGRIGRWR